MKAMQKQQQQKQDSGKVAVIGSVSQPWDNLLRWCKSDTTNQNHRSNNARPHECKTCGKRFALLENLNRHKMIHTNQRPFRCPYCSKSFRLSQHLKEHIRIHTGEKPYKCHVCGHAFCQISNLKSHQKTHTKVKGFKCDQCGKEFRRSFTLKQHKLTHSKVNRASGKNLTSTKTPNVSSNQKSHNQFAEADKASEPEGFNPKSKCGRRTNSIEISPPPRINPLNSVGSNFTKNAYKKKNHDLISSENFMSFWNSVCRNPKISEDVQIASHNQSLPADFFEKPYSQMPKFFDLSRLSQLHSYESNKEKRSTHSLINLPLLLSENSSSNVPPCNLWEFRKGNLYGEKDVINPIVPSSLPNILKITKEKLPENEEVSEKCANEIASRKRKQAHSLNEAAMSPSTILNGLSSKNSFLSKSRHYKSLTLNQDYNWKRQLWREWLDEEVGHRRSSSAEASRDSKSFETDSKKHKLTSLSADSLKSSLYSSVKTQKFTRCSSSLDDDVFSPFSANSVTSATSSDTKYASLPSFDSAQTSNKKVSGFNEMLSYTNFDLQQKSHYSLQTSKNFINNRFLTAENSVKKYDLKNSQQNNYHANDHHLSETSKIPSHLNSKTSSNPYICKNQSISTNTTDNLNFNKLNYPHIYDKMKSEITTLPTSTTWLGYNLCFSDNIINPNLPISPELKSLSSRFSFVPLVTWKPVVTGWRNILDGNVYPARVGVDNVSPYSLQRQIS